MKPRTLLTLICELESFPLDTSPVIKVKFSAFIGIQVAEFRLEFLILQWISEMKPRTLLALICELESFPLDTSPVIKVKFSAFSNTSR